jgi:hypothetical protein
MIFVAWAKAKAKKNEAQRLGLFLFGAAFGKKSNFRDLPRKGPLKGPGALRFF